MIYLMILAVGVYVLLVCVYTRSLIVQLESEKEGRLQEVKDQLQHLEDKKDQLIEEKRSLEDEALKIFTLYEITKDITKSLSETEAFVIFKQKLSEHVHFKDCRYIDPESEEPKDLRKMEGMFVFTLQGKRRKIGYLAIEGLDETDKEKFIILAGQFALALRRVKLYQEIERIAITDSLTDVHTRRYFLERFEEELRRSKTRKIKMSVLMIDVDHFKKFNDSYGHLTGDQILREIGYIIKENIREIDIAGRYGGEEFCVVLPDTDRAGALFAADRIRKATELATIRAYDTEVQTTVSVGITTFPQDGKALNELIDKADWALYRAKKMGRNKTCSFGVYKDKS